MGLRVVERVLRLEAPASLPSQAISLGWMCLGLWQGLRSEGAYGRADAGGLLRRGSVVS